MATVDVEECSFEIDGGADVEVITNVEVEKSKAVFLGVRAICHICGACFGDQRGLSNHTTRSHRQRPTAIRSEKRFKRLLQMRDAEVHHLTVVINELKEEHKGKIVDLEKTVKGLQREVQTEKFKCLMAEKREKERNQDKEMCALRAVNEGLRHDVEYHSRHHDRACFERDHACQSLRKVLNERDYWRNKYFSLKPEEGLAFLQQGAVAQ